MEIKKFDVCKDDVRTLFAKVKNQGRNYVHETEAVQVVKSYGFQTPKSKIATNEDDCVNLSKEYLHQLCPSYFLQQRIVNRC
jgi:hypothetical protein